MFYPAHTYTVRREEASVFLRKTKLQGGWLRPLSIRNNYNSFELQV